MKLIGIRPWTYTEQDRANIPSQILVQVEKEKKGKEEVWKEDQMFAPRI
jgi:hypothetical protein